MRQSSVLTGHTYHIGIDVAALSPGSPIFSMHKKVERGLHGDKAVRVVHTYMYMYMYMHLLGHNITPWQ